MRLKYGSLQNCLADNAPAKLAPEPGMGATIIMWSDRHAATITAVRRTPSGRYVVTAQRDRATRTDHNGMSESQKWL